MLTARVEEIRKNHHSKFFSKDGYAKPVCLSMLRSRIYTQVFKETEGELLTTRRAKAFARYLDTVPIFIRPHEFIVGWHAEDPSMVPFSIESVDSRLPFLDEYIEGGYIREGDKAEWLEYMDYWKTRTPSYWVWNHLTEEEKVFAAGGHRYAETIPTRHLSRTQPEYDLSVGTGLNEILEMLHQKLDALHEQREKSTNGLEGVEIALKITDVKAMILCAEAVLRWANRYSQLAKKMAEEEEDPQRKEELLSISEMCSWVPGNRARSFWEVVQGYWLTFLAYHIIELMSHGTSVRLDQIFWPWYEKDVVINHTLPREKALEIMEDFLLRIDELGLVLGREFRRASQGSSFIATYTIGGVKTDGTDACNELTILILDAMDDLRLCHPDFKFRWHPKVNPKVWRRAVEVVRSGLGQPAIKNDPPIIAGLMNHYGFTLEEARSWAVIGCVAPVPTIHWSRARRDAWQVNCVKYLELALNNGVDPIPLGVENLYLTPVGGEGTIHQIGPKTGDAANFESFDELFEAFRQQWAFAMRRTCYMKTLGEYANSMFLKRPFLSCFYHRSLDACKDIMDVPDKTVPFFPNPGQVDVVDSLIALKKLVFDDKKYSMKEVCEALRADWEGYEEMRQEFINAPKFGNNDDYADEVARRTYDMLPEEASKVTDISGASPMPSGLVVTWMTSLAPVVGALPNGRKRGDPLADGGCSPHAGYDKNGPMAAVLSASKIDMSKYKANVFNQKLTPTSVAGESGLRKFQNYIETAMHLGLDMIQFNVVTTKMLREAQQHPTQYQDLVVRVSGYNARFLDLDPFTQEAIIQRTVHEISE